MINPQLTEQPQLSDVRAEVVRSLTKTQLEMIGVWLGMEALEAESPGVFKLGKRLIAEAQRKEIAA